jgi:hypothetical protein
MGAQERPCVNPTCFCQTTDVTCSLWCGALDRPADARCVCRHDGCARPLARSTAWTVSGMRSRPVGLDPLGAGRRRDLPGVGRA